MTSSQPPSQRGQANRAAPAKTPRERSTIGVNPLDVRPTPAPARRKVAEPAERTARLDMASAGQRVFAAWASGTEDVLTALFQAQTAVLRANLSVLDATASAQTQITREWTEAARQAQAAALEAFRASLRAASPAPAEDQKSDQA